MQKFDTAAPVTAVVDIAAGRIQFIAADRTDTTVEVRPANPTKSRDVKAAEQVTVGFEDGVLRVKAAAAKNRLLGSSGAVEVTVQVPTGSRVEAKAAAAEFRGVGRLGDVDFEGGHRTVKIDETTGARLRGLDADIVIGRLTGPGEISTQQGNVNITEATGGALTLSTQQGDINVTAGRGVSAALDAGTMYGRISNSLRNEGGSPDLTIKATVAQGDITATSL